MLLINGKAVVVSHDLWHQYCGKGASKNKYFVLGQTTFKTAVSQSIG